VDEPSIDVFVRKPSANNCPASTAHAIHAAQRASPDALDFRRSWFPHRAVFEWRHIRVDDEMRQVLERLSRIAIEKRSAGCMLTDVSKQSPAESR
jgi:hypothetical protein